MNTIDRYFTKLFIKYVCYSFIVSFVIFLALAYIDAFELVSTDAVNLFLISFYRTLANMSSMMQFIILISTILLIFNLQKQRMIIVLKASGLGNVRIFRSVIITNFIIGLLFIFVIHPLSNISYNNYFLKIRAVKSHNIVVSDSKMNLIMQHNKDKHRYYILDSYYKKFTNLEIERIDIQNISLIEYFKNIPVSIIYANYGSLSLNGSLILDNPIIVNYDNNKISKKQEINIELNYNIKKLVKEIVADKKSNIQFKNIYDVVEKFISLSRKGKESIIIWRLKCIEIIRHLIVFLNMSLIAITLLVSHSRMVDNFKKISIVMIVVIFSYSFDMFIVKVAYTNMKNSLISLVVMPHLLLLNFLVIHFIRK
jgi:lipopolysaccharide export LptBFGC system permease protein LptF